MNMAIIASRLSSFPSVVAGGDGPPPPPRPHSTRLSSAHTDRQSRRNLLSTATSGAFLAATSLAIPEYPPKSPLIEQLLEKSRANKTKNDQMRLDSYYERNFKEYFEFVEGTIKNKTDLSETEKGILKWLEKSRSKKK